MIKKLIRYFIAPSHVDADIEYLVSRGWRKEPLGWFQSFDPDLPEGHPFRNKSRSGQKINITLEEALYYARMGDKNYKKPITPPESLGIDPTDDVWV